VKDFGSVPQYLQERRDELERAQAEYECFVREQEARGQLKQLSDAERAELLAGLKGNWEEMHRLYQTLSVMIDTIPKKLRKERIETEMRALERDIEALEKHSLVYIAN